MSKTNIQEYLNSLFNVKALQENVASFYDVKTVQENLKKFYDVEAIQENLKKFYDVEAAQEAYKKFYDKDSMQKNLKTFYNADQFQANLNKLFDNEAVASVRDYTATLMENNKAEESAKLAADLVSANTKSLTDALILQSVQMREGIEAALKQADTLSQTKNPEAALEAQKAYLEQVKATLTDNFWMNVGLVAGAVESNADLVKGALEDLKPAK